MFNTPVIDVHAHVFPQAAIRLSGSGKPWHGSLIEQHESGAPVTITGDRRQVYGSALHYEGPEARLARMDALGVDIQVLSVLPPLFRYDLPTEVGVAAARDINDDIADWCQRWPNRFRGLATLPLQDPNEAIRELDRAMDNLGLLGVEIDTTVRGQNLDDPALFPVFAALARRNAFVFCHPSHARGRDVMTQYYLNNLIGNPWETAVAMASLFFGGVLDRLPGLVVCFAHGGGFGPFGLGRLNHGYEVRPEPGVNGSAPPRELARRVYVDSLVHDDRAMKYLIDTVGLSHVLFGTDFPADMGPRDPVGEVTTSSLLAEKEKEAVLGGNAASLFAALGKVGR